MDDTNATGKNSTAGSLQHSLATASTEPWGRFPAEAWKRSSKAVVANGYGSHCGAILWTAGPHIRMELEETGLSSLEDLGLDDAPHGISIWEGSYHYSTDRSWEGIDEGGSAEPRGSFRVPTEAEWLSIKLGKCPWSDLEWGRAYDWGGEPEEDQNE